MVPVIRDVDKKGLLELAKELGEVSERMRAGKVAPADLQGGCFSISSLGGIGGTHFTPIINAPEVAILGVGKVGDAAGVERQGVRSRGSCCRCRSPTTTA